MFADYLEAMCVVVGRRVLDQRNDPIVYLSASACDYVPTNTHKHRLTLLHCSCILITLSALISFSLVYNLLTWAFHSFIRTLVYSLTHSNTNNYNNTIHRFLFHFTLTHRNSFHMYPFFSQLRQRRRRLQLQHNNNNNNNNNANYLWRISFAAFFRSIVCIYMCVCC